MTLLESQGDAAIAAAEFARENHRKLNHRRKYTNEPYESHLEAVAKMVAEVGGSSEMIAAAWLHDIVEDTKVTVADIERIFGLSVATLVSELTDISSLGDGNRKTRKKIDLAHIADASPQAKTIKLADLIHNADSIIKHDTKFAKTFINEMEQLLDVLLDGDGGLYATAKCQVINYYNLTKNGGNGSDL